ncbi:hypothetical protein [Deinococcus sonorensis]|uniref:Uncharacterized protein n=2 Tax=Deinococcus sonorensis TaxID=309891 RepID=A0AAU7U9U1_9DEIO
MFRNIRILAAHRLPRTLLALSVAGMIAAPSMAAGQGTPSTATPTRPPAAQAAPRQGVPTSLQVSYYAGDPLAGGKLLQTVTLKPPQQGAGPMTSQQAPGQPGAQQGHRGTGATPDRQDPVHASAPAGATFAVIRDGRGGARIVDLSQPMQGPGGIGPRMQGPAGPDQGGRGPGTPGRGGQNPGDPQGN